MLAHVPMPMQTAESRMGSSMGPSMGPSMGHSMSGLNPYYSSQQHSMPIYPQQVPYSVPMGYHPMQRQVMPVEVQQLQHVPLHVPVASYHRPVYQAPYQTGPYQTGPYRRQATHSRSVIEIPIEIPIPVHIPIPVSVQSSHPQHIAYNNNDADHDTSASEAEQVAIVYYDPEEHNGRNDHEMSDHLEPQTSESHENGYRVVPSQKSYPYLSRPLPDTQSATKMKLWREYVGAKYASNPGVRYVPVAVTSDDSQSPQAGHDSHMNQEMAESQSHPAFVILADDSLDAPQEHH